MLNKIKALGLVLVIGMGLNLVGCEDVEEPTIQDTKPQAEEQLNQLTEEEKINTVKEVAKNNAINVMEEKGIDCLPLKEMYYIMYAAVNNEVTKAMGLDVTVVKNTTAEGLLEVANLNDGTMIEDIVYMYDYIEENNLELVDNEEFYMIMNGETWEDILAYREVVKENWRQQVEEYEHEIRLEIFGLAATDIVAHYYEQERGINVKVEYEHIATGRNLGYILINTETWEHFDYINY